MDLEVIGRHALLFDDDATADFVNSGGALVDWHSLQLDRYDVRHLLSSPPPPRRRNRNSDRLVLEDPDLESQLDHERYLDLPRHSDQPDIEEFEKPSSGGGYNAVAFSYGENDCSTDPYKADTATEFSGFSPPFPVPGNLLQCLPPTEKAHQIIARTAMFVSRNGGQSEFVLRVKQGDNPTFGFLMPDHHLHPYFRYLVEHSELLHSEYNGKSRNEAKDVDEEHHNTNGGGGALSLLGSAYGSVEEEDGDGSAKTEFDGSQVNAVINAVSHGSKKMESNADVPKDVLSRNTTPCVKEKVFSVKKNSLIAATKSGNTKGKKDGGSCSFSVTAETAKSFTSGLPSKTEPIILEPPLELKGLIDKIVEYIIRNGKQFEATLIEQDRKHERFSFLLPANQYYPYYLKVLKAAQESKTNGKGSSFGKDDRKGFIPKKNELSSLDSDIGDMPLESDIKEKFKMVIGKSKKEVQESRLKETQQECGITVDAAAAAAILQAAIKGGNRSNLRISNTPLNVQGDINHSHGNSPSNSGGLLPSQTENADQNGSQKISTVPPNKSTLRASNEVPHEPEAHLTEDQKVKAERLKRAKTFVAMLKSGAVPLKNETSRASSLDPPESRVSRSTSEIILTGKDEEGSSAPADVERTATVENLERIYLGDEHSERLAKRKYRSRSGACEDDDDDEEDGDKVRHKEGRSRSKYRSRSRRHDEYGNDENENVEETDRKHYRRCRSRSSGNENDEGESDEEDRDHEFSKPWHRSHHSQDEDDEHLDKDKKVKDHKQSKKKHRSHHSSRKRQRSSKKRSDEENGSDGNGRDHRHSRKKHRSHHSSDHSGNKRRHRNRHSSKDRKSRHHSKHDNSSDNERQNRSNLDKCEKETYGERDELEEGEISSKASEESRGIASGHASRETSVDALIVHERAKSQPSGTSAEVPDDLRAKIRAMLMATRL